MARHAMEKEDDRRREREEKRKEKKGKRIEFTKPADTSDISPPKVESLRHCLDRGYAVRFRPRIPPVLSPLQKKEKKKRNKEK